MLPDVADPVFAVYAYSIGDLSEFQFAEVFRLGEGKNGLLFRVKSCSGSSVQLAHVLSKVFALPRALLAEYMVDVVPDVFVGNGVVQSAVGTNCFVVITHVKPFRGSICVLLYMNGRKNVNVSGLFAPYRQNYTALLDLSSVAFDMLLFPRCHGQ
jgi:hypothetical protein